MATVFTDKGPALSGTKTSTFRADEVKQSLEFRKQYESRTNVVLAEDMPWEHSADGLIKHLVHEKLGTREQCVDAYMLFLKEGDRSGKHRHMCGLCRDRACRRFSHRSCIRAGASDAPPHVGGAMDRILHRLRGPVRRDARSAAFASEVAKNGRLKIKLAPAHCSKPALCAHFARQFAPAQIVRSPVQ